MFEKKTLFIIGAGCSVPFKFPLGYALRQDIHNIVARPLADLYGSTVGIAFQTFAETGDILHRLAEAQRIIAAGLFSRPSIDQFLDYHSDQPDVIMLGKLLIAFVIINREAASPLAGSPEINGDWLERVFHLASDGVKPANVEDIFRNLSFVCFNYDRCIEYYLFRQVLGMIGGDLAAAKRICCSLEVIHPYGRVGPVPWREYDANRVFGMGSKVPQDLLEAAKGLRTFTEEMEPGSNEAQAAVGRAKVIAVSGFGYIPQNLEVLTIDGHSGALMLANMYGVPPDDVNTTHNALMAILGVPSAYTVSGRYAAEAGEFMRLAGGRIRRGA